MSKTAHKIDNTFRVTYEGLGFYNAPWYPVLERDNPSDTITTEAGTPIELDGQTTDTIVLHSYKIRRNTFIAVGGGNN